jgi:hypothetical protein
MRIFTAVRHSIDPRHFYGGLWSGNFYPALRRLGYDVVESQVDLEPASRFMEVAEDFDTEQREIRAQISERIVGEIKAEHQKCPLDLCLFYFYNAHFEPAAFDEIHGLGIPTINFFCNSIYQFELVAEIARKVRYSWHAERDTRPKYLEVGATPVWVQMAADPEFYHPVSGLIRQPKAFFMGMNYADRAEWMAALLSSGVPVDIYGVGWATAKPNAATENVSTARGPRPGSLSSYLAAAKQCFEREGWATPARLIRQWNDRQRRHQLMPMFARHARGSVPFTQIAEIFSSYEICLNFSNVWSDGRPGSSLIPHVRLRDFEGPMCRTCYLTGHTSEIEEFYKIGEEIDTYTSEAELVEKTKFYLAHPDHAERLREAGYQRARRDHTWDRRFEELFQKTGFPAGVGDGTPT